VEISTTPHTPTVHNFYPSEDIFFATEAAAQAAAENTVQELYRRAGEQRSVAVGIASVVVTGTAVAAIAAWKSPMGRKVRNKIANAIKAE
jgi:hypothetical protein